MPEHIKTLKRVAFGNVLKTVSETFGCRRGKERRFIIPLLINGEKVGEDDDKLDSVFQQNKNLPVQSRAPGNDKHAKTKNPQDIYTWFIKREGILERLDRIITQKQSFELFGQSD